MSVAQVELRSKVLSEQVCLEHGICNELIMEMSSQL